MNFSSLIPDVSKIIDSQHMVQTMDHAGYKAKIMASPRLQGMGTHGLPPGKEMPVIPIEALPGCPNDWIRSAGTYVIPVKADVGIWFNWTLNPSESIAIVPSVKRVNPITGLELDDLSLVQYRDLCPKHNRPFTHGLVCPDCDYAWPAQNYISYPNTLWWDGFRRPDGTVAQFFYTDDEVRDVANTMIGKNNTVPAFGFGIFRYKHYKSDTKVEWRRDIDCTDIGSEPKYALLHDSNSSNFETINYVDNCINKNINSTYAAQVSGYANSSCVLERKDMHISSHSKTMTNTSSFKEVFIGGGASIRQDLLIDQRSLDDYYPEPQAVFRIYFVFSDQLATIVRNGGVKEIKSDKDGFLKNIPTG